MKHELRRNVILQELLENRLAEGGEKEQLEFLGQAVERFVGGGEESDGGRPGDRAVIPVAPFNSIRESHPLKGRALKMGSN